MYGSIADKNTASPMTARGEHTWEAEHAYIPSVSSQASFRQADEGGRKVLVGVGVMEVCIY